MLCKCTRNEIKNAHHPHPPGELIFISLYHPELQAHGHFYCVSRRAPVIWGVFLSQVHQHQTIHPDVAPGKVGCCLVKVLFHIPVTVTLLFILH